MLKTGIFLGKRYEIIEHIGAGGMADVYKGKDHKLNRYVAIKVLKSDFRGDESFVRKFLSEAQAAAGLMHPNVVNVYDVGQDRGLYYMVMELVEGITLKDYISKKGSLSAKETISIAIQMVTGIQAAHNQHIIHRDIKPQNIIISNEGKVKVTDFGIARATTQSQTISSNVIGSVHYIAPEQVQGDAADERSDIYSIGITLYEMVTGTVPFDGDSAVTIAVRHLKENAPAPSEGAPDIPYALECIIVKCMQRNPARRYQSCQELIADLKRALVDPEGDFVYISPYAKRQSDETVLMTDEELQAAQLAAGRQSYGAQSQGKIGGQKSNRNGAGTINPNTKKIMRILLCVAVGIIAIIGLVLAGKAFGWFKSLPGTSQESATAQVVVPDLTGMTEEEAKTALSKKNLGYVVETREASDQFDSGKIISQSPKANAKVDKNTEVKVVVSTGKEIKTVTVPDVRGQTETDAQKILENNKLVVQSEAQYDSTVEAGRVISTDPTVGLAVQEGSTITMYVSMGPETVIVPSLVGMDQSSAVAALSNAGLNAGNITTANDDTYASGQVCSQSVAAGEKLTKGATVDFVISEGKTVQMVSVPKDLRGESVETVTQKLANKGLYTDVRIKSNNVYDEGTVTDITDSSGNSVIGGEVEAGSTVIVLVSSGSQE